MGVSSGYHEMLKSSIGLFYNTTLIGSDVLSEFLEFPGSREFLSKSSTGVPGVPLEFQEFLRANPMVLKNHNYGPPIWSQSP